MTNDPDPDRMRALEARLAKARGAPVKRTGQAGEAFSSGEIGWRMITELVAGLLIGFGIGYGLDVLLGTLPLCLIVFTLLGFAAGIRTMMRTAQSVQSKETTGGDTHERED
ncbi:AtpZ/AtpI family protein [Falsirhodobacter algicola]|uniref:ATP synthase protein I n=1 Tax=Falsirhodobacter algicola TaxID=2692330 RepID=A0A8J8SLL7_9RHOB|nr:AtpZ/AtpI family protein [Falsirhodobacter algicola]QUS36612.1 F0F1 ATP synthase subunit I [Falsirhodobacter algicola]